MRIVEIRESQVPISRYPDASLGYATLTTSIVAVITEVPAYAAGGYTYPGTDIWHLSDEVRRFLDHGYTHIKIKIGASDCWRRILHVYVVANANVEEARIYRGPEQGSSQPRPRMKRAPNRA
jgi:hypothetical protein